MASQQYCSHHKSSHVLHYVIFECPRKYIIMFTPGSVTTGHMVQKFKCYRQTDTEGHKKGIAMLNFTLYEAFLPINPSITLLILQ
jgi:hypothetical protein